MFARSRLRFFSVLPGESIISKKLSSTLNPSSLVVTDVSGILSQCLKIGGCGSMYSIEISSDKFKDLSLVQQHRLVQDILKEEIKEMHGLSIKII
jgi:stress-induced morphogen